MSATGTAPARVNSPGDVRPLLGNGVPRKAPRKAPKADAQGIGDAKRTFEATVSILERLADAIAVVLGVIVARAIYETLHLGKQIRYPIHLVALTATFFALVFVYMMDWEGGYQRGHSLLRIRETERILRAAVKTFLFVFPITFLVGQLFSRWLLALTLLVVPLTLIGEKKAFWQGVRWMHYRGHGVEKALIYGAGSTGRRVFSALMRSPKLGLRPVAVVDDNAELAGEVIFEHCYRRERSVSVIPGPLTKCLIEESGARQVIIAIPSLSEERFSDVLAEAMQAQARVAFVPRLSFSSPEALNCAEIDGLLISELGHEPSSPAYDFIKRVFDLVASLLLIALAAPLGVLIGLLIWTDSRGPVLFSQNRIGRGGKPFRLYKFRSMYVDAPKYAFHPKEAFDSRITRIGRFLRRTSLDELPQLMNVLRGEMSLVGPRPEMPFIVEQYDHHQRQRLEVLPGITGIWQLSADRSFLIHENMLYDLYYIRHRGFFMDVAILLHTVAFAMKGI
jgi:exopolysaccharide biosynthesis polyprenyl glycosylphosphotransferase